MNKIKLLVCKKSVSKILKENGFNPIRSSGIGWFRFIKSQATFACDYFEVETLFLKRLNVFFMIDIHTRAIIDFAITCDRDTSFGGDLKKIPYRRPVFNCFAERMVKTFREELTDRVIFYGEKDLRRALKEYVEYYNHSRIHSSLGQSAPLKDLSWKKSGRERQKLVNAPIQRMPILSGLITDYKRAC